MSRIKFEVLSRQMAENEGILKRFVGDDTCCLISITDEGEANIPIVPGIYYDILRLNFHDIDRIESDRLVSYKKTDAERTLDYIDDMMKANPAITKIIVHCEAGVSRSAGVAAGLSYILNGSDFDVVDTHTCYNRHVYTTLVYTYFDNELYYRNINKRFEERKKRGKENA